jgi:branched-chain amino acid transport system substrate-binding protein
MTSCWRSRPAVAVTAAVTMAALLSGCTGDPAATSTTVHVGLVASLSGAYQPVGEDTRDGFALYLQAHGGRLGGHPVELTVLDEAGGGAETVAATTRMVQRDRVLALTGVTSGETLTALLPVLRAGNVPLVGSNGRPGLDDVKLVWSTSFLPDEPGRAISGHLRQEIDGPVWTMATDNPSGRDDVSGFVSAFTAAGGRLANPGGTALFTANTTNFLPILSAAKASGARAVYAFYVGAEAVTFVQQYAQSDARDLPLFAPGLLTEGRVLATQGRAALGVQTVLNYAADLDNPANRAFVDAWRARHTSLPTAYAMASWDAALVLDKAIAAAGPEPTPAAVDEAIAGIGQIDSPRGLWQFSGRHAPVQKWYLRRVQADGRTLTNSLIQDLDILGA